jgi:catechol 2,3-dioxygenase-like lactoylglutathione lyase family enzyme
MTNTANTERTLLRPVHHISYVVADLRAAIDWWVTTLGAGPFFIMEDMQLDEAVYLGEPCVFDHSTAFGQWGPIAIELQELHDVQPAGLAQAVSANGAGINHAAFVAEDPVKESARLADMGMPMFLRLRKAHVEVRWHEAPQLGHPVEIHRASPELVALNEGFAQAARDWDGSDPVRPMPTAAYVES